MSKSKMVRPLENAGELILALYHCVSTDKQVNEGCSLNMQIEKL